MSGSDFLDPINPIIESDRNILGIADCVKEADYVTIYYWSPNSRYPLGRTELIYFHQKGAQPEFGVDEQCSDFISLDGNLYHLAPYDQAGGASRTIQLGGGDQGNLHSLAASSSSFLHAQANETEPTIAGFSIGTGTAGAGDLEPRVIFTGTVPVSASEFLNILTNGSPVATYQGLVGLLDDDTVVMGSAATNYIEVGAGDDEVAALAGDDLVLKWKSGDLTYDGGAGNDSLSFNTATGGRYPTPMLHGAVVDLATGAGQNPYGGTIRIITVENVEGTPLSDTLTGNDAANILGDLLEEGGGADVIHAGGGNDVVHVGLGAANATVDGGEGIDELQLALRDSFFGASTVLDLENPTANTGTAQGGSFTGLEIFSGIALFSTASVLDFRGDANGQTVSSTSRADFLRGRGGADYFKGGRGGDSYFYRAGDGNDIIVDQGAASDVDTLRLEGLSPAEVGLTQVGSNLVVHLAATGETVTIAGHFLDAATGLDQIQFDSATWDRTTIAANTTSDSNHAPVAGIIHVTTSVGSPITFSAFSAASDPDTGDQLGLLDIGAASWTASRNAGSTITYTPHGDSTGFDFFTYTIGDGRGGTATSTVNVKIQPAPSGAPPVIVLTGGEDFTVTVDGTTISAPTGNHVITLNAGDATIAGGIGHNAVIFRGASSDYSITHNTDGSFTITDLITGRDGSDHLDAIEALQFTNKTIFIENADNANIARLYSAALGRAPDQAGLFGWEDIYANNISAAIKVQGVYAALAQTDDGFGTSIAGGFAQSAEFTGRFGALDDAGFVTQLYLNVLDRTPALAELNAWLDLMHSAGFSRDMVLVGFAESPENIARTAADWLIQI